MNRQLKMIGTVLWLTALGSVTPTLAQIDRPTFFRDGQRMMDQEIRRLEQQQRQQPPKEELEHPSQSQLLTINEGQLRWQKFIFRDEGFSVWMPEGIRSEETVILDTIAGKLPFEVFTSHPPSWRFVAAYSENLDPAQLKDSQAILASVRDGIVAETKFDLMSDRSISLGQYPGKQLSMQDTDEIITFRVYLIGQRVYVLAAGQKDAKEVSEDVVNFFDSFRLLQ